MASELRALQFQQGRWKIDAQDRLGMGPILDLESLPFQSLDQHHAPFWQFFGLMYLICSNRTSANALLETD
jgi:hypothetical protein